MKNTPLFQSLWLVAIRAAGAFSLFGMCGVSQAASFTFNGLGADGKFTTTANWVPAAPASQNGNDFT